MCSGLKLIRVKYDMSELVGCYNLTLNSAKIFVDSNKLNSVNNGAFPRKCGLNSLRSAG